MEIDSRLLTVSELNRRVRIALENEMGEVYVEGEISRLTRHASGHWYFTLKDASAAVACALFRQDAVRIAFAPQDGMKVRVRGQVTLYETGGRYQLIARAMEEAGRGTLQQQFEELKVRLAAEGLFAPERKKKIPLLPRRIGIVTSPTGAALRDIIQVVTRRFPNVALLLAPVTVQGDGAAKSIAAAIQWFNSPEAPSVDVLIVGRGGGSLEDLWAFNEESVARAVAASRIPVISAVGHEIDFTICDFAADLRAPTPSAAAELAVPVKAELDAHLSRLLARLESSLKNKAQLLHTRVPSVRQRMSHSLWNAVQQTRQRVDESTRLLSGSLLSAAGMHRQRIPMLRQRLEYRLEAGLSDRRQTLSRLSAQLRALSPLAVLERGYSLVQTDRGIVVRCLADVQAGETVHIRLATGKILATVTGKENSNE